MEIDWYGPINYVSVNTDDKPNKNLDDYLDKSGVYLIAKIIDNKNCLRYVGQTNKFNNRLKDHESSNEKNELLKKLMGKKLSDVKIFLKEISDKTYRDNLEYTIFVDYGGSDNLYNKEIHKKKYIERVKYPKNLYKCLISDDELV